MYSSEVATVYDDHHLAPAWPRVRKDMMPSETVPSIWITFPTESSREGSPGDILFATEPFPGVIPADLTIGKGKFHYED